MEVNFGLLTKFKPSPQAIIAVSIIPALANSDHLGLMAKLSFKSTCRIPKGRVVWRYSLANWERACDLIEAIDWHPLLNPIDINKSWTNWSNAFLNIMEKCIPKATLPGRKNRPWLSKKILQAMRRRNMYYKRAKASKDYTPNTILKETKSLLCSKRPRMNFSGRLIFVAQRNFGKPVNAKLVIHFYSNPANGCQCCQN